MYSASSVDPTVSILLLKTVDDYNEALQPLPDGNPPFIVFDLEYGRPPKKQDDGKSSQLEVDLTQIASSSQVFLVAFRMSHST